MSADPPNSRDVQTEERILEAAHRVFIRQGMARARTQDIADEAGVNRALINYYFRSKKKLADAVFMRAARSLFPGMMRVLASDLPLRDKLHQAADLEIGVMQANPYLPSYVLTELQYNHEHLRSLIGRIVPIEQVRTRVLGTLQAQLDAEANAGRIRPTRAEDLLVTLLSLIIFPFVCAKMLDMVMGIDAEAQGAMHDRRREMIADFIMKGLQP